jgi:ubiquitin carboxyl-terminal hydrolase 7
VCIVHPCRKIYDRILLRSFQTLRPTLVDLETDLDRPVIDVADSVNPWTVFFELSDPAKPEVGLPTFDKDSDVMLFFKFYDPAKEKIHYMGHMYVSITSKVSNMIPELVRRANLPENTQVRSNPHM